MCSLAVNNITISFRYCQVISVTFMKGGDAYNVIPESVSFGGTFRSLTSEGLSYLKKRIKEVSMSKEALFSNLSQALNTASSELDKNSPPQQLTILHCP